MSERDTPTHNLIKEFRTRLAEVDRLNINTDAVVVLSAPQGKDEQGCVFEDTPENIARINYGVAVTKEITSAKIGKKVDELTPDDIRDFSPLLVLNGETIQLPMMQQEAIKSGFPEDKVHLVNSGDRGTSNTKTQFEVLRQNEKLRGKFLSIVTTGYHLPRVDRTAAKQLPNQKFEIIAMPYESYPFPVFIVRREIKRIQHYVNKGDIAKFPRKNK